MYLINRCISFNISSNFFSVELISACENFSEILHCTPCGKAVIADRNTKINVMFLNIYYVV